MKSTPLDSYRSPYIYYGITYELRVNEVQKIEDIQKIILNSTLGSNLLVPDSSALHITITNLSPLIFSLKHWRRYDDFIQANLSSYKKKLRIAASQLYPFTLTFDSIEAYKKAVILRSSDHSQMNEMRNSLSNLVRFPGTTPDPNIVHCTIIRYKSVFDLSKLIDIVSNIDISIDVKIDKLSLVRGDRFFSKPHDTIMEFNMGSVL